MTRLGRVVASACPALVAMLPVLLAGCMLGPDFFSPAPPEEKGYTAPDETNLPPADTAKKAKQRLAVGAKVEDEWWTLFRSPELNRVMKEALANSPTIAQAQATLAAAREQVIVAQGATLPQADLSAGLSRQQFNPAPSGVNREPVPETVYAIGPSVTYAADVFGGLARGVETQQARADVSEYQLAAAYLALTGNIARQAITIAAIRAQIKATERIIADDARNLGLVKTQQGAGTATMVDVTTAESQLANDRALLPPLRQQLSAAKHALAVFAGRSPADYPVPDFDLERLTLPRDLPVTVPSELVRNRPDILAAEAQLHVASATIGVATANLYPSLTLGTSVTQSATDLGNFFSGLYTAYNIGAVLTAPIFRGGALKAQQRAAVATFDAAFATYRGTVLQSFGQVADVLQALKHDEEAVIAQSRALATAGQALKLARLSFTEGNSTLLQVLDAERQYDRARIGLVQAESQRVLDTAQLFVALGSGWWNTPPTVPPTPEPQPAAAKPAG
jgi:NodT family efflux transporter outer membrane factor (OMF) lipoprotein